ncbi:MAG TPA: C25 family cysteine peptidase [Brumimicrobium sp.]|nr:C25 family cysteine peptidase [Brumimicrobium sp.]
MRFFIVFISVVYVSFFSLAQPYGNEWINYNQKYYQFPVVEDGIYRISYQSLIDAGIPVASIAANKIQVFGKQKEIPLYIQDNGDNSIDAGDYIEFFAEKNDGWLDSLLYDQPTDIGNPAYSLYSDTLYYFLTWTTGLTKRYLNETDVSFSIYSTSPYVLAKSEVNFNTQYYGGYSAYSSYSSFFSAGEGWGGPNYNGASNYSLTIPVATPNVYSGAGAPAVEFHAKSNANSNASFSGTGNHHLRWEVGGSNLLLHNEIFTGYRQTVVDTTFSVQNLSNGTSNIFFKIVGDQGAATDYQSVSYLSIKYPRATSTNASFIDWEIINAGNQAKSRIDINGANLSNPSAYITGGNTSRKIPFVENGGVWQGLIPNSTNGKNQRLIIASQSEIKSVPSLKAVNGTGQFTDYSLLNLEAAYIILYNQSMLTSAGQYATYRRSVNGGSHNVVLCEVNDAWLQYGGGVPKHILGSRRAINHIYNLSTLKPVALFIAGKGVSEASDPNTNSGGAPRKNSSSNALNLVPSYGNPSSDLCITARWNGASSFVPAIPTGRIAAKNDAELNVYLNKIRIYEAAQNQNSVYNKETKDWQKQILHFGGGLTAAEQNLLQGYLNGMKTLIEGPSYGGNVSSYFKETSNPFNPVQNSEVNDFLESGVSLMTFFGHASADGFDQNIDDPSNWGNAGKYPMVIGNGCYTGDIYKANYNSTAEHFVMIEDLGAIGFLSSTKLGYASYLNTYSKELYKQMSPDSYGATMGEQMVKTISNLESVNPNFLTEVTAIQMVLHGDPSLRLNWHTKPEIDLTIQDVFFTPTTVDLTTDSISVGVVLTNLGKSIEDTFALTITRNFPNTSTDSVYTISIAGLDYKDTINFKMPLQASIASGMNQFIIQADLPSFIPEQYDEYNNNEARVNFFIDIDGIIPVLPHNYAVVPNDSVVLKASTVNPIAAFNTYRFEIDTTDLFNSPFRKYANINGMGGVKEVFPADWKKVANNANSPLVLEDSMVYFWRVSVDSSVQNWSEHSFQYIPGKTGWGQDHFFQFKNGGFNGVAYDRPQRERKFESQQLELSAQVHDNANSVFKYNSTLWQLNGQNAEYGMCTTTPSLHVGVVSPSSIEPWGTFSNGVNADHQFGNANNGAGCRNRIEYFFIFRQNTAAQLQAFENMVENEVPDGHYMVIYSTGRAMYNQWQTLYPNLFNTLQSLGATGITPTSPERAFILIVEKGNPASARIIHAQTPGEYITLSSIFTGSVGNGVETSTVIGPALNWKTLYWKQSSMESPSTDSTRLVIRGLNPNQQVLLEIDTVFSANDSILNLNNLVDASQYPYLQLQAKYYDNTNLTPAQVDRWHVLYDRVPEAAIDGTNGYVFSPNSVDSLQEGVEVSFAIDIKNISDLPMDSLLVHYWVTDKNQVKFPVNYPRQNVLLANEVLRDTVRFSTVGLAGGNTLWMEVNPYVKGINNELKDQPELAHFNNLLQIPFYLNQDNINPILDVTFDGDHILNGDIVSPAAEIVISLKDENQFLIMDEDSDTTNFGIFLTNPAGEQKRMPFVDGSGNQVMQWIPADGANLRFKILYNAQFETGGIYELMVQGSDKSGNLSGKVEYRIKFEVVLESSITHLMNYPNPFSTQTRFVFTLTGTQVPEDMIIQIMTVTGRIVREITEDELGFIRIGRNITEYAWDGRDEFGDPLANGVYLYRVKAKINGEDIKHRSSGADKHFTKSWGKMYLMR